MDLTFTDANKQEKGSLQNFNVDFDATNTKDFQLTTGINNNVLQASSYWYIAGTEFGGKIDKEKIITETREIQYFGRNARGLLASKIIEPSIGSDHLVLSGTLQEVLQKLIDITGYSDLFVADRNTIKVSNYKFDRYINLYDGIVKLLANYGRIPKFTFKSVVIQGKVQFRIHIGVYESVDYSDAKEYTQDDMQFTITKSYSDVNHLICLGQGELKDRMVIHLYADAEGNVSTKQTFIGEHEVVEIYENTNATSYDELMKEGIEKLKELKNTDSFEVTVPDIDLRIGDIIGGLETNTNTYVARAIVNIIAKINDNKVELEYKVGEDDTASSSSSSSGSTSASSSDGGLYNLPPADKENLGGVIIGDGINVDESGKISVSIPKITIDTVLSKISTNPVQNKVVAEEFNKVFRSVSDGKKKMADAITDKGVLTSATATFDIMAQNVEAIRTGVSYAGIINNNRISTYTLIEEG